MLLRFGFNVFDYLWFWCYIESEVSYLVWSVVLLRYGIVSELVVAILLVILISLLPCKNRLDDKLLRVGLGVHCAIFRSKIFVRGLAILCAAKINLNARLQFYSIVFFLI